MHQNQNYKVWPSCSNVSGLLMNSKSDWWRLDWSGAKYYPHCWQGM